MYLLAISMFLCFEGYNLQQDGIIKNRGGIVSISAWQRSEVFLVIQEKERENNRYNI
jgi:hypothetical protein